jgi:HK97 family phage portal protein
VIKISWFSNLFKKKSKETGYAAMLSGATPIFSQFGDDVYASDVVQQAIFCIVQEMKKLTPQHIRQKQNKDITPIYGNIQSVLNDPNPLMTTNEFIEKIVWSLYLNYNAFIIPVFYTWEDDNGNTQRNYKGLYPVQPREVDFYEDAEGNFSVNFKFGNGEEFEFPYSEIIHIKYKYSVNEFMGGNDFGQPDNGALLKTLELNEQLLQGVSKAMKSSFAVNGIVKYKTLIDAEKTEAKLREFETKINKSESGFVGLDLSTDYVPIDKKLELVDAGTLKFIDEKILRTYGVPLAILTGDYTKEQYEAFYQKTLEPLITALSQAFTKTLFTKGELSHGNKIQFFPRDLIFMSVSEKLEFVRLLGDSGTLYENEKRVAFGLMPLAVLEGVRMQSLNYVNVADAQKYQIGNDGGGGGENNAD